MGFQTIGSLLTKVRCNTKISTSTVIVVSLPLFLDLLLAIICESIGKLATQLVAKQLHRVLGNDKGLSILSFTEINKMFPKFPETNNKTVRLRQTLDSRGAQNSSWQKHVIVERHAFACDAFPSFEQMLQQMSLVIVGQKVA